MRRTTPVPAGALSAAALAVAMALPGTASAQSIIEDAYEFHNPDSFLLTSSTEREIVNYTSSRDVEVCLNENPRRDPPQGWVSNALTIEYDGKTARVEPGNCFQFDAKRVVISPAEPLADGYSMRGRVRTFR
ncbi:MAG: hypothetical protein HXY25_08885 [Alphaproteobacteria bacterium]|nr:hypothetical protein [Alphaproteobacteria bacterium]